MIKPLPHQRIQFHAYSLYHYNWIQDNIKKVDKATNGKVGYIYIPDMGPEG